jgi:hypothetical protein
MRSAELLLAVMVLLAACLTPGGCAKSPESETSPVQPPPDSAAENPQVKAEAAPNRIEAGAVASLLRTGSPRAWLFEIIEETGGREVLVEVPEGNLTHSLRNGVVLANDCLTITLRRHSSGAQVQIVTSAGLKARAAIGALSGGPQPPSEGSQPIADASIEGLRIVENSAAAVAVEAPNDKFRITMGQPVLEVTPGKRTGIIFVRSMCDYLVVPNFFGDDRFYDAQTLTARQTGLPTENCYLTLGRGRDSMMMCTWATPNLNADAILWMSGTQKIICGCQVECLPGKPVWLAFMEGKNLWHGQIVKEDQSSVNDPLVLDWRRPFPAKWRGSWRTMDNPAEIGSVTTTSEKIEDLDTRVDLTQLLITAGGTRLYKATFGHMMLVLYLIDRSAATPLDVFTPMDILRNTLGVGPCQYVLDTEGLGSDEAATGDTVAAWIEKQLKKPDAAAAAEEIAGRIEGLTAAANRVVQRVKAYGDVVGDLERLVAGSPDVVVKSVARLRDTTNNQICYAEGYAKNIREDLAGAVAALRKSDREPAMKAAEVLKAMGAAHNRALAECRMAVREVKQAARAVEWDEKATAAEKEAARKVRAQVEEFLYPPHTPEKKQDAVGRNMLRPTLARMV